MMWLTHYDAAIVGSNDPFVIDETDLERRISEPAVAGDLGRVTMGSAANLLGYFVMGATEGMKRFAQAGTVNTDDRLYLEFSAPFSIASPSVMQANVEAIAAHRESILPYLQPAADPLARAEQRERWNRHLAAGRVGDPALALFLGGRKADPEVARLMAWLERDYREQPARGAHRDVGRGGGLHRHRQISRTSKGRVPRAKGTALTFLPFLVKATAHLLPEFPTLNARWTEEGIRVRKHVHLGIAIALPDGLVVPVLRSPGSLAVSEIAVRIADNARRAQEGRLLPEELTGGTFTVNNFGADGNLIGTPVLNQP